MNLKQQLIVRPGKKAGLARRDPGATPGARDKDEALELVEKNTRRLAELQYLLYAESKRAVLIVIQAMDTGGKDGVIRHVMTGLNPQGCRVTSFKVPSSEELKHDFLWRIHRAVPAAGEFGIFNRSHYEDVLVVRVHKLVPEEIWSKRYEQINAFEKLLTQNNVTVVKFFLHISKEEQKRRIQERIEDPTKQWKLSPADFQERKYWADYMQAYEDVLTRCSTPWAPWYVVAADHKWSRNLAVSQILVETLKGLDMKFPEPTVDVKKIQVK
jgi:PPK2 family polyphosphate:nucleotide phosphotransferase